MTSSGGPVLTCEIFRIIWSFGHYNKDWNNVLKDSFGILDIKNLTLIFIICNLITQQIIQEIVGPYLVCYLRTVQNTNFQQVDAHQPDIGKDSYYVKY